LASFVDRRALLRLGIAFGLAVVVLTVVFAAIGPVSACGPLQTGTPMLDFEFAISTDDLERIFGEPGSICQSDLVREFSRANRLDLTLYIPAYGLFLLAFFAANRGASRGWAAWIGMASVVGAMVNDVIETRYLLMVTNNFPGQPEWLVTIWTAATVKFALLGIASIASAILMTERAHAYRLLLATIAAGGGSAVVYALLAPGSLGLLAPASAAAWLAILADMVCELWTARNKQQAA
jgi:hypothetical protein